MGGEGLLVVIDMLGSTLAANRAEIESLRNQVQSLRQALADATSAPPKP